MTATLERAESANWMAHATIRKFSAAAERDTMHDLAPKRATMVDEARKRGLRLPRLLVPRVSCDEMLARGFEPFEVGEYPGNLLCNAGINRLESLLIAGGGQAYDNTHTAIGVGDGGGSTPSPAATDTDLVATVNAANRYFQLADPTYPSAATQVVTVQATFATGNANFHWQEWGIDQHTASGATASVAPLLNHKGVDLGTKTSAAAWAFKVTVTIS